MSAAAAVVFSLADEDDTARLMADLALLLSPGDTVTLSGDLGAGKTTAARALIRYLAGDETLDVPSPTFTLVQLYDLPPFALLHGDLYRIADDSELDEIGLSPWPEDTVTLIEWPERAADALPADRLDLALRHDAGGGVGGGPVDLDLVERRDGADAQPVLESLRGAGDVQGCQGDGWVGDHL